MPDDADQRRRLDLAVAGAVAPVSAALAALYLVFAVMHPFLVGGRAGTAMSVVAGTSALVLGAVALVFWRRSIPAGWAHPLISGIVLLAAANSVAHLLVTGEPQQSTNVMLVVVGAGAGLLVTRWFVGTLVLVWAAWLSCLVAIGLSGVWVHWVFAMVSATLIAAVVHVARRSNVIALGRAIDAAESTAVTDALTGLANRRGLDLLGTEVLDIARVRNEAVSASFVDVDGLKAVNDTYGHDTGDEVLLVVAQALRDVTSRGDVVARWGGDEFVVVTGGPGFRPDVMESRLRLRIHEISPLDDGVWPPQLSVGRAVLAPWEDGDLVSLLDAADRDMYRRRFARRGGEGRGVPAGRDGEAPRGLPG